jgi:hypothetical protein
MKDYKVSGYSYVGVTEISREEVERVDFDICKQPTETLENYYKRQLVKPNALTNSGFFVMNTGETVGTVVIDGKVYAESSTLRYGIGIPVGGKDLVYDKYDNRKWTDFQSGYPVLIADGQICPITCAQEINYKARRTVIGFNDKSIFILSVDSPGMNFAQLQKVCYSLNMKYAINCDGGGSTRRIVNGVRKTAQIANRPVDTVFAVYTKRIERKAENYSKANQKLNIRSGPGASHKLAGTIPAGAIVHTVSEMDGDPGSAPLWGKLCDGRGWAPIGSPYTSKL